MKRRNLYSIIAGQETFKKLLGSILALKPKIY